MSEQKHTPGPWFARQVGGLGRPGQVGFAIDFNADQEQVVDFVYEKADAHLIAASPDLLAAASDVIQAWGKFISSFNYEPGIGDMSENIEFREMQALRRAVAKAKGEA